MPAAFARLRELWRTRHKDNWELKLWTETDVETFGLENRAAYDAAGNFGEKSDILRYEVGVYEWRCKTKQHATSARMCVA